MKYKFTSTKPQAEVRNLRKFLVMLSPLPAPPCLKLLIVSSALQVASYYIPCSSPSVELFPDNLHNHVLNDRLKSGVTSSHRHIKTHFTGARTVQIHNWNSPSSNDFDDLFVSRYPGWSSRAGPWAGAAADWWRCALLSTAAAICAA